MGLHSVVAAPGPPGYLVNAAAQAGAPTAGRGRSRAVPLRTQAHRAGRAGAEAPDFRGAGSSWLGAAAGLVAARAAAVAAGFDGRRRARTYLHAGSKVRVEESPAVAAAGKGSILKWQTFWCCFFGYSVCYFTRQSLSYTAPFLREAMGWDGLGQIGQLSSIFPLAYGSSRFLGGVLGDLMSPKKVFCLGLSVCGLLNLAFGLSSTMPWFVTWWFLNGCFQGLAAPPCVKMITNWFDPKERGFWWSVWHASINLGGFLIPFLAGGLAQVYGWRYGMLGPGVLALVTSAICLVLMRDGPVEATAKKEEIGDGAVLGKDSQGRARFVVPGPPAGMGAPGGAAAGGPAAAPKKKKVSLVDGIMKSPPQWYLALAYLFVYVCRQGLGIWGIFYLLSAGVPSAAKAASLFSGFELGGFFGNLTGGTLSDFLLRRAKPGEGEAGQRAKVVMLYFLCTLLLLPALARCPASMPWLQYLLLLGLGHFLCGAQLLLPLIAAEQAPTEWRTTATGFIGWVGYFGAALSGLPLSYVVQGHGWGPYFSILTVAAGCGAALSFQCINLKSRRQMDEEEAAAA